MNVEIKKAEDAFKQGLTFFLTGKAGTGKSFFLKNILKDSIKKCVVLAPTGMSAIHVNGQTIHSFFKFPVNPLLDPVLDTYQFEEEDYKYQLIKEVDCIIIDEISMVRADLLDAIDYSLRINGGNENLPFGGKQMVFIGDLMQLPPIIAKTVQEHYFNIYNSLYFVSAEVFKTFPLHSIELKHVYRQQTDGQFLHFLNEIRDQSISQSMLDYINKRVGLQPDKDVYAIRLMTTNNLADEYNKNKLEELNGKLWSFKPEIEGEVPTEQRENFKSLELKIDSQVSFNKNDMQGRYFNGSIGKLIGINDEELTVELNNGIEIQTGKYKFELFDYKYDTNKKRVTKNIIGTITQFPVQLAWAITIHKSQGQTYENAVIDMGSGAFTVGQTYVAFSRVKSYEGLFLTRKLYRSDIIKDAGLITASTNIINLDEVETVRSTRCLTEFKSASHQAMLDGALFDTEFSHQLAGYYRDTGTAPSIDLLVSEINNEILPDFFSGYYNEDDILETLEEVENGNAINLAFYKLLQTIHQINIKAKLPDKPYAKLRSYDLVDDLIKDIEAKKSLEKGLLSKNTEKSPVMSYTEYKAKSGAKSLFLKQLEGLDPKQTLADFLKRNPIKYNRGK